MTKESKTDSSRSDRSPIRRELSEELALDLFEGLIFFPHEATDKTPWTIVAAHLYIEKNMRKFVALHLESPERLDAARLSFHQYLCLAESISNDDELRWIWRSIRRLNRLRNKVAHDVEFQKYPKKEFSKEIDDYCEYVERESPLELGERDGYSRLDVALRSVNAALISLVHKTKDEL